MLKTLKNDTIESALTSGHLEDNDDDVLWSLPWEIVGLSEISELNEEDYKRFLMASILHIFGPDDKQVLLDLHEELGRLLETGLQDFDLLSFASDIKLRILIIYFSFQKLSCKGKLEFLEGELKMYESQYGWFMSKDEEFLRHIEIKNAIEELWIGERKYKEELQETEI